MIKDRPYQATPDADGTYRLGPDRQYLLSPEALHHILTGDIRDRPVRTDGKFSYLEKILKGGLHTAQGWIALKETRTDLVHGAIFQAGRDSLWYFARELQNDVILLRIPREIYQSGAAKLTKFNDVYYKSGYLWKTLFPEKMTTSEIIGR